MARPMPRLAPETRHILSLMSNDWGMMILEMGFSLAWLFPCCSATTRGNKCALWRRRLVCRKGVYGLRHRACSVAVCATAESKPSPTPWRVRMHRLGSHEPWGKSSVKGQEAAPRASSTSYCHKNKRRPNASSYHRSYQKQSWTISICA